MKEQIDKIVDKIVLGALSQTEATNELLNLFSVRHSAYKKPPRPHPNDYYESQKEANEASTRVPLMTWKEEYEMDLKEWERHYA